MMGEIADAMVCGSACSGCAIYFVEAHGYPVLCDDCWEVEDDEGRETYSKATHAEL